MCGTSTAPGSGDTCSTFEPTGSCVVETLGVGALPAPTGGSFVAGTYDLVSKTLYADADGGADAGLTADPTPTRESSILTGSGDTFAVQNVIVSGSTFVRSNGTLTTSGTTKMTFQPTCPAHDGGAGDPGAISYSVVTDTSGTRITVYSDTSGSGRIRLDVYKKR
jgi:hypothetical protein